MKIVIGIIVVAVAIPLIAALHALRRASKAQHLPLPPDFEDRG